MCLFILLLLMLTFLKGLQSGDYWLNQLVLCLVVSTSGHLKSRLELWLLCWLLNGQGRLWNLVLSLALVLIIDHCSCHRASNGVQIVEEIEDILLRSLFHWCRFLAQLHLGLLFLYSRSRKRLWTRYWFVCFEIRLLMHSGQLVLLFWVRDFFRQGQEWILTSFTAVVRNWISVLLMWLWKRRLLWIAYSSANL